MQRSSFRARCQPLCHLFGWWSCSWMFSTRRCTRRSWCIHLYTKSIATYAGIRNRGSYDCTPGKAISAKQGPHLLNSQDKCASRSPETDFRGTRRGRREFMTIKNFIVYYKDNFRIVNYFGIILSTLSEDKRGKYDCLLVKIHHGDIFEYLIF